MNNWLALFPLSIVVGSAILILLLEVFLPPKFKRILPFMTMGLLGAAWLNTWSIQLVYQESQPYNFRLDPFNGFFVLDHYAAFFYLFLILATMACVLFSSSYLERESLAHGEYYSLMLFALSGAMILASSADLMTLFIGLEIMSMAVYILVGFRRLVPASNEAALKYFFLGSFASALFLYGVALLYGVTGSTKLASIAAFLAGGQQDLLAELAVLLLLAGMAFKVAAAPFHLWTPDAYEGAPMPVTAFMATVVKGAAFAMLVRVLLDGLMGVVQVWTEALWWMAVLTLFLGNLFALRQQNIKRLMAYSSIVHTGYLLVGVVALTDSVGSPALNAILYYLYVYALATLGVFGVLGYLSNKREKYLQLSDYAGLAREYPLMAAMLALFLFSMIGFPPLGGFFGKYYLFSAAISEGYTSLAVLAVLNSILSIWYYLRLVVIMYMQPTAEHWKEPRSRPLLTGLLLVYLSVALVWAGIGPARLLMIFPGVETLTHWIQLSQGILY